MASCNLASCVFGAVVIVIGVFSINANAGHHYGGGGGDLVGAEQQHYGGGQHQHAIAGEFEYKVDVKHPSIVSSYGDHKHHHALVEDHGIQIQKIKVGIYPHHEESYGHHGYHGEY